VKKNILPTCIILLYIVTEKYKKQ